MAYPLPVDPETGLFIVLDGHGEHGDVVSNELLAQLYEQLSACAWSTNAENGALSENAVASQLVSSFETAHSRLVDFEIDPTTQMAAGKESGAAAVVALLGRGRLTVAHSGDCRAVLGTMDTSSQKLKTVELTHDHKLEDPEEAKRLAACGAYVRPTIEEPYFSPARVYKDATKPSLGPGLTMARSLGDMDADEIGVIPTPEVSFRTLSANDKFIVLASDGVWEFLSSEHVVEIVGGFLERGEPAVAATRFLIAKAAMAWRVEEGDYRDDITAIVLYLNAHNLYNLPGGLVGPTGYGESDSLTKGFKG